MVCLALNKKSVELKNSLNLEQNIACLTFRFMLWLENTGLSRVQTMFWLENTGCAMVQTIFWRENIGCTRIRAAFWAENQGERGFYTRVGADNRRS